MKNLKISIGIFLLSFVVLSFVNRYNANNPIQAVKLGEQAPELKFQNPEGKEIALSSLKGSYVLLDFWASWCGPCRRENPNVVAAYNKYKDLKFKDAKGGFKIYNVSLDQNKEAWINGIKQDNLTWEYHVSDLKGWQSEASRIYGVNSIPANFLIDPQGKIIAYNLRGGNLLLELEKYVVKK
jgi:thiol-disulfide isomerase/thioredoxin